MNIVNGHSIEWRFEEALYRDDFKTALHLLPKLADLARPLPSGRDLLSGILVSGKLTRQRLTLFSAAILAIADSGNDEHLPHYLAYWGRTPFHSLEASCSSDDSDETKNCPEALPAEAIFDLFPILLERGYTVDFRSNNGNTPLLTYCGAVDLELELFENQEAPRSDKRPRSNTFLVGAQLDEKQQAVVTARIERMRLLLRYGADPYAKNLHGWDARHVLAELGHTALLPGLIMV